MPKRKPLRDHVLSRLVITPAPMTNDRLGRPLIGPCLIWTGAQSGGYGCVYDARRRGNSFVHRLMMEWFAEPVTDQTDHLCRVPLCGSPAHLEDVSIRDNTLRGDGPPAVNALRTSCSRGHGFTDANTRIRPNGSRVCRTCARDTARQKYRAEHGISPTQINNRDDDTCVNGHARTAANTRQRSAGGGRTRRRCLLCERDWATNYREGHPRRMSSSALLR